MRRMAVAVALWGLILLAGCAGADRSAATGSAGDAAPKYAANWGLVKIGMSKAQVTKLLGHPVFRATYSEDYTGTRLEEFGDDGAKLRADLQAVFSDPEMWQYGRFGLARLGQFDQPQDDAFIVYFNAQGEVVRLRRPVSGPFATGQPDKPADRDSLIPEHPERMWEEQYRGRR